MGYLPSGILRIVREAEVIDSNPLEWAVASVVAVVLSVPLVVVLAAVLKWAFTYVGFYESGVGF